jgi:hypothetical protein
MDFIVIIVLALYGIAMVYSSKSKQSSAPRLRFICKMHIWRLRDKAGWLPQDEEIGSPRWRAAEMICAVCHGAPLADARPPTGEYEG